MTDSCKITPCEASGYLEDSFEGLGRGFSEITELSRSAQNIVLKAKRYGRLWLLKGASPESRSEGTMAMLRKELEVMLKVNGDGVVKAWSLEEVPGYRPCIVMEWVEGLTLDQWLALSPKSGERIRVAQEIVMAVGRIHRCGVVHRDLKPTNIIVTALDSSPVIIDFGLADTFTHTVLKQAAGTRGYISREQAAGALPDVRNDIYSLGVVLAGMGHGLMWSHVIRRCLGPINRRYADTDELLRALERPRKAARWITAVLGVSLAGAGLWLCVDKAIESARATTEVAAQEAADANRRADSLAKQLAASEVEMAARNEAMRQRVALVADSARSAGAASAALMEERDAMQVKDKKITAAIDEGTRRLDRVWEAGAMKYLAENSAVIDRTADYSTESMSVEKSRYMKELAGRFTVEDLARIEGALNERIDRNYAKWIEKKNQMISND